MYFGQRNILIVLIALTAALVVGLGCKKGGGGDSGGSDDRPDKILARPANAGCLAPATTALVADTLSGTGCFNDTATHEVASGVIAYTVNNLLWTDGEKKGRYFAIPDGETIDLLSDGHFDFPVGSVVIKTFFKDSTRLETRILMNHETDDWVGYAYKWNVEQTDATLLDDADTVTVGSYVHQIPSPSDCMECHLSSGDDAYVALANETLQQNYDQEYNNDETENFLDALDRLGFFTDPLDPAFKQDKLVAIGDPDASVEEQARSYLHANCYGCHRPATFLAEHDLRYDASLAEAGCGEDALSYTGSPANLKVIDPGDPSNSSVVNRMGTNDDEIMMPPLGRSTVDQDAVDVVSEWIDSLSNCD